VLVLKLLQPEEMQVRLDRNGWHPWFSRITGIVLTWCAVGGLGAQQASRDGFKIQSVSVSETYFAQAVPDGIATYGDVFLGSAISITEAASITWKRTRAKSFSSFRVLPVYSSRMGDSQGRSWNGTANFTFSRTLASKWTVSLSGNAQVMNFDESLFGMSTLRQVASTTTSYDDLSGAILKGQSFDPQLNATAYNSLQPNQNLEAFLFGQRTINSGGQTSLTYAQSARLSVNVSAGGMIVKNLQSNLSQLDPLAQTYPQVTSTNAAANLNYSLSPRTQIGASVNVMQSKSSLLTSNVKMVNASLNRTMSRRWFMQASLGIGSNVSSTTYHRDGLYTVGLGFKTYSHTLLVALNRTLNDPYAAALASLEHSRNITATWHYLNPGSAWWLDSEFSQLIAIYKGVPGTNTWSFSEKVGRRLGRNYAVILEATKGRVGAKRYIFEGRQYQLQQTGIRTTFSWSPQPGL
jgi:hypothetical protein